MEQHLQVAQRKNHEIKKVLEETKRAATREFKRIEDQLPWNPPPPPPLRKDPPRIAPPIPYIVLSRSDRSTRKNRSNLGLTGPVSKRYKGINKDKKRMEK